MMVRKESEKRNDCWADWEETWGSARQGELRASPSLSENLCQVPQQRVAAWKSVPPPCSLVNTLFKTKLHLLC